MIKRKWPKVVAALGFHSSITPVAPEVRASLSLPRESDKERPGSPPGPRAGRQPSSGGCRPGPPAVRGGVRASTGPRVERVLPKAQLPCGGRQPSPPAVRGGIWASATPWIGCKSPPSGRGAACRRQAGGFHFQPEGLAARRLALKDCKMTPTAKTASAPGGRRSEQGLAQRSAIGKAVGLFAATGAGHLKRKRL